MSSRDPVKRSASTGTGTGTGGAAAAAAAGASASMASASASSASTASTQQRNKRTIDMEKFRDQPGGLDRLRRLLTSREALHHATPDETDLAVTYPNFMNILESNNWGWKRIGQTSRVVIFNEKPGRLNNKENMGRPGYDLMRNQFANGIIFDFSTKQFVAVPPPCLLHWGVSTSPDHPGPIEQVISQVASGVKYKVAAAIDGTVICVWRCDITDSLMISTRRSGDAADDDRGGGTYKAMLIAALSSCEMSYAEFDRCIQSGFTYSFVISCPKTHLTCVAPALVMLRVTHNASGRFSEGVRVGKIPLQDAWNASDLAALIKGFARYTVLSIGYAVTKGDERISNPLNAEKPPSQAAVQMGLAQLYETITGTHGSFPEVRTKPITPPFGLVITPVDLSGTGTANCGGVYLGPIGKIAHGIYATPRRDKDVTPLDAMAAGVWIRRTLAFPCIQLFPEFGRRLRSMYTSVRLACAALLSAQDIHAGETPESKDAESIDELCGELASRTVEKTTLVGASAETVAAAAAAHSRTVAAQKAEFIRRANLFSSDSIDQLTAHLNSVRTGPRIGRNNVRVALLLFGDIFRGLAVSNKVNAQCINAMLSHPRVIYILSPNLIMLRSESSFARQSLRDALSELAKTAEIEDVGVGATVGAGAGVAASAGAGVAVAATE
jgi:hypothetical protein